MYPAASTKKARAEAASAEAAMLKQYELRSLSWGSIDKMTSAKMTFDEAALADTVLND